ESPRVNAFRRNGLRRPAHKILDIETSAAAGLRAGEKDSAAIGEPTGSIVMDRIMSDLLCLPRAGGQEHKLCGGSQRRGDGPFAVGREGVGLAAAEPDGGGIVHLPQVDGVLAAASLACFDKEKRFSVR